MKNLSIKGKIKNFTKSGFVAEVSEKKYKKLQKLLRRRK